MQLDTHGFNPNPLTLHLKTDAENQLRIRARAGCTLMGPNNTGPQPCAPISADSADVRVNPAADW